MAFHSKYWTCSRFADWLRGTSKLKMGTAEEWDTWTQNSRNAHPFRHWLADEFLDFLQDAVTWPVRKIYDLKYYINNRWVTRTHALTANARDIKPGTWRDVGNRFLPCLFNELVDFVEIELAWSHIAWNSDAAAKYEAPWYASGWFRWRTWRSPEAGLANLEWQRNLRWSEDEGFEPGDHNIGKPTHQAIAAQEILDLYTWWTQTYRNRPDPHDASGWTAYCELSRLSNGGKLRLGNSGDSPELKNAGDVAFEQLRKIEEDYEREDTLMMKRLIDIRNSLWT